MYFKLFVQLEIAYSRTAMYRPRPKYVYTIGIAKIQTLFEFFFTKIALKLRSCY